MTLKHGTRGTRIVCHMNLTNVSYRDSGASAIVSFDRVNQVRLALLVCVDSVVLLNLVLLYLVVHVHMYVYLLHTCHVPYMCTCSTHTTCTMYYVYILYININIYKYILYTV